MGWCAMIGSDAPYYGAFLAPEAAEELWPSIDAVTAGQIPPNGRARPVDGGYVVDGRWAFGSGCTHADVIVGGCLVMDGDAPRFVDGRPDVAVMCAPASSWTVLDTWHTTGLAGSGSNDYTATELFVPERHAFRFSDPVQRPEPLYGWPGMFFINMAGVALGLARRAIDETTAIVSEKMLVPEMVLLRDTSRARLAIAQAEAAFGAARAYVYDSLDRFWDAVVAGDAPSIDVRVAVALSRAHSFRVAREMSEAMCDLDRRVVGVPRSPARAARARRDHDEPAHRGAGAHVRDDRRAPAHRFLDDAAHLNRVDAARLPPRRDGRVRARSSTGGCTSRPRPGT